MYKHTQPGTLIITIIGLAMALIGSIFFTVPPAETLPRVIIGIVFAMMVLIGFLFGSLTVKVDRDELVVAFGPGLVRLTYLISEITEAEPVRNRWWYGFGVRYTPHGWLYNVSGLDAVQINLRNGRTYRVGTDEPTALAAAIHRAMDGSMESMMETQS